MTMLYVSLGFFGLAALLGAFLMARVLRSKPTPKGIAMIHGSMAVLGIVCLLTAWAIEGPTVPVALALFGLAALGGFYLLYMDLFRGRVPKPVAIAHALVALSALALLARFAAAS